MTSIPIVDTHMHLWDPAHLSYAWIKDVEVLNRPFLLADYQRAIEAQQVTKMVFVQCEADQDQYVREAEWVTALAKEDPRIAGIVPWAPLEQGDAARDALAAFADNRFIKGIRRIIQYEDDLEFCLRADFVRGVQLLDDFDFHFEICIKGEEQFAGVLELVRRCPNVRFILDHIGKPNIVHRELDPWRKQIGELARMENTWCKMSGLVVEADMKHWTLADLQPYIDVAWENFGPDRIMFGGDWPVVTQAAELHEWISTLLTAVSGYSEEERRKLFHDNATSFYRLD
jgi:L-fuconolactonase